MLRDALMFRISLAVFSVDLAATGAAMSVKSITFALITCKGAIALLLATLATGFSMTGTPIDQVL